MIASDAGGPHCRKYAARTCVYITCYKATSVKETDRGAQEGVAPRRGYASLGSYESQIINRITNTAGTTATTIDSIVTIVPVAPFH